MTHRTSLTLALSLIAAGCTSTDPELGASEAADSATTETGSETGLGPETEDDTSVEPDLATEPDLPSDDCRPYAEARSFEEVCFAEPIQLDPAPVNFLASTLVDGARHYYVAGPDDHRVFADDQLEAGATPVLLPIAGTAVQVEHVALGDLFGRYAVVTKDPNALVLISVNAPVEVIGEYPLDAEPTALAGFRRYGLGPWSVAIADVNGRLILFDTAEMGTLIPAGSRELDEPIDRLEAPNKWTDDLYNSQLLGLSRASSTVWRITPPVEFDGLIAAWPLPNEVSDWRIGRFADTGDDDVLLFSRSPAAVSLYDTFEAESTWSYPLDHAVDDSDWGRVPYAYSELYAISSADGLLTSLAQSNGRVVLPAAPTRWIEIPEGTSDFLALDDGRFLFASPAQGLILLSPQR